MKKLSLAKRYVSALRSTLVESEEQSGLQTLVDITASLLATKRLRDMLHSPLVTQEEKTVVVEKVLKFCGADQKISQFFKILIRKNRLHLIESIYNIAKEELNRVSEQNHIVVLTPKATSSETKQHILKSIQGLTKNNLMPEFREDPSLLGGFKALFDNKMIDASVQNSLNQLLSTIKSKY